MTPSPLARTYGLFGLVLVVGISCDHGLPGVATLATWGNPPSSTLGLPLYNDMVPPI